jgi:hypothetical protein
MFLPALAAVTWAAAACTRDCYICHEETVSIVHGETQGGENASQTVDQPVSQQFVQSARVPSGGFHDTMGRRPQAQSGDGERRLDAIDFVQFVKAKGAEPIKVMRNVIKAGS